MTLTRRTFLGSTAGAFLASPVWAGPEAELIDGPWSRFGEVTGVDDTEWRAVLAQHWSRASDGVALFDYAALSSNPDALRPYLDRLEATDPTTLTRNAAFAFWVNAYNAFTIDIVARNYPVQSIREINGGFFNTGPWGDKITRIGDRDLSLDNIEHGILRPVWGDARVHYAVNCASIGCPDLKATPWTVETLDADLEAGARGYVNHPRGISVDARGRVTASKIYDWFVEDFGDSESGVLSHVRGFANDGKRAALADANSIRSYEYDWDLNEV